MISKEQVIKGTRVIYIPNHADDRNHSDCETGVIKRATDDGEDAFVIYDNAMCIMITGDEPYTAARTSLHNLELL